MKKLTILTPENQRRNILDRLYKIGTVHVKNLKVPSSRDLTLTEENISRVKNAVNVLKRDTNQRQKEVTHLSRNDAPLEAEKILSAAVEIEDIKRELRNIETKMDWFNPWGAFNPKDISELEEKGVFLNLYKVSRSEFKKIKTREGTQVIKFDGNYVYVAQVSKNKDRELSIERINLPKESLDTLSKEYESLKVRQEELKAVLKKGTRCIESFEKYLRYAENKRTFLHAVHGMKEETKFSYIAGFCPEDKVSEITALSKKENFGYLIEDPEDPEEVPTLIRNPKWINIISPIFKFMNTIPGYKEHDISLSFLVFFSLFFAMLIGDAGYGILFIILTYLARKKLKNIPPEPFRLMYTLSIATVIWGAITGTWFGAERIATLPVFNSMIISEVNSFVDGNQNFMIFLCFIIGVIHLTIAHLFLAVRVMNSVKALAEVGWILILWGLFFTAGTLVIGRPFPGYASHLLISGAVLVLFFSNPQRNIIKGISNTLINLPLKIVSSFSDVVSYLRLFAVGYASSVVAQSFNNMAMEVGFGSVIGGVGAAFILFFGHALNIILGFMAVIVHGVRLNMLEFSGQMGMEWSGKEYKPFKETQELIIEGGS